MRRRTGHSLTVYAREPSSQANNIKALRGTRVSRLRVGDFRVIFGETQMDRRDENVRVAAYTTER